LSYKIVEKQEKQPLILFIILKAMDKVSITPKYLSENGFEELFFTDACPLWGKILRRGETLVAVKGYATFRDDAKYSCTVTIQKGGTKITKTSVWFIGELQDLLTRYETGIELN